MKHSLRICLLALLLPAAARARDCPTMAEFRSYRPPQATRVFALDGSRIADLSPERRVLVPLSQVPEVLRRGFVAVEDRRFFEHDGVDLRGVGRALLRNLRSLSLEEGFSTITMQLARNVFPEELPFEDKLRRKYCEVQLAGAIEDQYTKQQILERYLNQVHFGEGLYGVEAAARTYFGKSVKDISLAEAALLIGLVKNPAGYNPRRHPERALERRNIVLDVMVREEVISAGAAAQARREPLRLAPPIEAAGPAPYVVAAVRSELRERFGENADVQGLRVYTGIDPVLQQAAQQALRAQLEKVESGAYGRYPHPVPRGRLAPAQGSGSQYLQGVVVIVDLQSGELRALVGGRDFTHSGFDRARLARRQPGSAFKPLVYAAAVRAGLSAAATIETTPVTVTGVGEANWQPDDLVPDSITSLPVRDALALSSNYGAIRVGQWVGAEQVAELARALGISTPVPPWPSIFLGAAEVIPVEFAAAYAALGNGGYAVEPTLIRRIEDAHGRLLWRAPATRRQVLDSATAFITTSMLQDVVEHGTGAIVRRLGFDLPAAGKTGTTNGARDVWFVGMTPELAGAVWLGFDQPKSILPNAFGGNLAAPVWTEVMKARYRNRASPPPWVPPASVTSVAIDRTTGHLATDQCPAELIRLEHFAAGTEPTDNCPAHPGGGLAGQLRRLLRGLGRIF